MRKALIILVAILSFGITMIDSVYSPSMVAAAQSDSAPANDDKGKDGKKDDGHSGHH